MQITNQTQVTAPMPEDLTVAAVLAIQVVKASCDYQLLVYVPYVDGEAVASLNALTIEALVGAGFPVPENLTIGWALPSSKNLGDAVFLCDGKEMFGAIDHPVEMYLEPAFHKFTAKLPENPPKPPRGLVFKIEAIDPLKPNKKEVVSNEQLSSSI